MVPPMESTSSAPAATATAPDAELDKLRWIDNLPYWGVHVAAVVGVAWVGFSWTGVIWAAAMYAAHIFAITGVYHRYFSHRAYKTGRVFQFLLALLGVTSVQKGPLWWAAHHRHHHKYSDKPEDVHSPVQRGFWWSHHLWILVKRHKQTHFDRVKDLAAFPELMFLEKYEQLIVVAYAATLYFIGGATALFYGFFVATVLCWHATFTINSLSHVWGKRRYQTTDDSRNNIWLALLTFGEGWHNNHHHYQRSVRQGFYWWEVDITYYVLRTFQAVGLVWDLHTVPRHVRDEEEAPQRARLAGAEPAAE
jgi:stearoyl-CoA desaturase (delta-9 desaturase)